jgi:hypothetical protein
MKRRNALVKNRKRSAKLWRARHAKYRASDRGQYTKARRNALDRGVEWLFDFDGWLKVWKDSGHYAERGRGQGQYQMARKGDCGPYADWNVVIVRMEANALAAFVLSGSGQTPAPGPLRDEVAAIL